MKLRNHGNDQKAELSMTSMIDVVFLLLAFFVMTFKIVEMEGDFNIRMPLGKSGTPQDDLALPIKLRLLAGAGGGLAGMNLNDINLGTNFQQLQQEVVGLIQSGAGSTDEGPEIEIDTDYNLRYEHVINAITAVSGYKSGNDTVKLIEKIKFAPPRK